MRKVNEKKQGYFIGVGCPGCGGELELEDDFLILTCVHCGSVLRLLKPDLPTAFLVHGKLSHNDVRVRLDRYLKERDLPLTSASLRFKNVYYPYWKIEATSIALRNRVEKRELWNQRENEPPQYIEKKKQEVSLSRFSATVAAGVPLKGIPIAIGLRTQFIKMMPYSDEEIQDGFDTMPVTRGSDDAVTNIAARFASIGEIGCDSGGVNRTDLVEPACSLVYFPFHIVESYDDDNYVRYLIDGVTGRILYSSDSDEYASGEGMVAGLNQSGAAEIGWAPGSRSAANHIDRNATSDNKTMTADSNTEPLKIEFGELDVTFHRCPNCGEDLPPRRSLLFICRNCDGFVLFEKPTIPLSEITNTTSLDRRDDQLFPFWSFTVNPVETRFNQAMRGIFDSNKIVIPAFEIASAEGLFRLAQRMSAAAPKLSAEKTDTFNDQFQPVDVGPRRALVLARVIVYRKLLPRNERLRFDEVKLTPVDLSLLYASFHAESYFYVDSTLGAVTFEKSLAAR